MTNINLPKWDLSHLYSSTKEMEIDLEKVDELTKKFSEDFEGKVANLNAEGLLNAVKKFEEIDEISSKVGSYAFLRYITDTQNSELSSFNQNVGEVLADFSGRIIFFTIEINYLPEDGLLSMLKENSDLAKYSQWFADNRLFKKHQLPKMVEKILYEKNATTGHCWVRLFDEHLGSLAFEFEGKMVDLSQILNSFSSKDQQVREKAFMSCAKTLQQEMRIFSLIFNVIVKDKSIDDDVRGFKQPISSMNLSNLVEDQVVESLIKTVRNNYENLSHKYYAIKAKWLGQDFLNAWDRNAPLPFDDHSEISWERAKEIVLGAYGSFHPEMRKIAEMFFENEWIDAAPQKGKESGAFSHPVSAAANPYILMNYLGKSRDVMTLAHELGHGIHQFLARNQGALMFDTPLTLAETASVFGEQLTFRFLLNEAKSENERKALIASKIEDMLNTVVRQISFCEFEIKIHEKRKEGEILPEEICKIWMETQRNSLGPSFRFTEEYGVFWSYISHFIHSPFYVYSYAFGDCLVNSLYDIYQKTANKQEFAEKYLQMLKAGGSLRHKELLSPFGINISSNDFWQKGLNMIIDLIDEL